MIRPRVYISGALSTGGGDREENVARAVRAMRALGDDGFAPFCPHLSHYAEVVHHIRWEHPQWIGIDLEWVGVAEAVYRLVGPSQGAEAECEHAKSLGIPVFTHIVDLKRWRDNDWTRKARQQQVVRSGDARFHAKLREIAELHDRKQADYGTDGDPFANVRASCEFGIAPWLGAIVRLNDKVSRIKSFAKRGSLKNEPLRDAFVDIAVYALIAAILYDETDTST